MKNLLIKLLTFLIGIVFLVSITMLDGKAWLLGGLLLVLSGAYLALFAKVKGLMKFEGGRNE